MSIKFWGIVAAATVGAIVVAKKVLDKKDESEMEEVELVEVDNSGESDEILELKTVYPFLPTNFLKETVENENNYVERFIPGEEVQIVHHVSYDSQESAEDFKGILESAGYSVSEDEVLAYSVKRSFAYEEGAVASDIFNVANQVISLGGNYHETFVEKV
ncbi:MULTISPECIES: hypothetical protein [Terrabacteria group]|uniref:hypothetical protein n=1 Tax=Bacillati TaxID=1783272 RepID=UPI00193A769D|nr:MULTISPECIES: hypothetical protein [Terrabacteria group]MBW9212644.1 hypothetical protein [Trueperella sp. zg.1013]QRG86868.1 hypothetical protein JOS54_00705 [Bulleidia sp. zg-1006]